MPPKCTFTLSPSVTSRLHQFNHLECADSSTCKGDSSQMHLLLVAGPLRPVDELAVFMSSQPLMRRETGYSPWWGEKQVITTEGAHVLRSTMLSMRCALILRLACSRPDKVVHWLQICLHAKTAPYWSNLLLHARTAGASDNIEKGTAFNTPSLNMWNDFKQPCTAGARLLEKRGNHRMHFH